MDIILNMSGVLSEEGFLPEFLSKVHFRVLDLSKLEGTNCYCSPQSADSIREALADYEPDGIHMIDTGDYHYLSTFFLEKIKEPFILVLLDNHSDRQKLAFEQDGMFSCGSWVAWAEEHLQMLKETISIGPDGQWIYPDDLQVHLPVYISLDLDILSTEDFITNWNQGATRFPQLMEIVSFLFSRCRVIGMDICGGITRAKGASESELANNRALRERLLESCSLLLN